MQVQRIMNSSFSVQQNPSHSRSLSDDQEAAHILPDKADMFIAYATVPGYR